MSPYRTRSTAFSMNGLTPLLTMLMLCPRGEAQQPTNAAAPPTQESSSVAALLSEPIISDDVPLAEVKAFCKARVPRMPAVTTAEQWGKQAERMRHDVLDTIVFRGEATRWRDADVKVEWLDTIPGGPGYHIRKLRYEALPGMWIPALLYEPDRIEGRVPVILNVNGHESIGKSIPYKQMRCINQAKRGMIALNTEWLNMGQLNGDGFQHYRMNQLDLCGTSGLAPFYLAMKRGLDILLAHPNADSDRVGMAGLSGGGWQTIFFSSLDTRVTLSNPVAGYSSFLTRADFPSDLGDSEQTPSDLATVVDYAHLTAMRAPRPTLLTYNAKDDCCFRAEHALPPLLSAAEPIFALYGQPQNLRSHINHEPGTHNFEKENREQLYRMLGDHFASDPASFDASEIPSDAEIKTADELNVPLPEKNADFHTLALALRRDLPRGTKPPENRDQRTQWGKHRRQELADLVHFRKYPISAEKKGEKESDGIHAIFWQLRMGQDWTVPAVELKPARTNRTAIIVADTGRKEAASQVAELLKSGCRVVAVDPFYFGESKIKERDFLYAMLVASVGERAIGIQAGQIASVATWLKERSEGQAPTLVAIGPRLSTAALIAAALEPEAIEGLELHQPLASFKQIIESNWTVQEYPELFCFGLLEHFELADVTALGGPGKIVQHAKK